MILDQKVTYFKNTRDTAVAGSWLIRDVLDAIRNGNYIESINKLRAGDEEIKKHLPTVAMHGLFEFERKKKDFYEASGLIILDIDDVELDEIKETKETIIEDSDHVLAVMTSPSGDGIKVLYYVQPELVTADNYRQIGKQIVQDFDIYGNVDFLSTTDCLIMTSDPEIIVNENAIPAFIFIEDSIVLKHDLEPLDETRELWDNAEDFFDTVFAADIAAKTNNNFHYIQVAILDLAKFGFKHPAEDLSFVVDYAESEFKISADNDQRFREVTELAKSYPQTKHPYKMISSDEPDDEYVDYSDMMNNVDDAVKIKTTKNEDGEIEVVEGDGFIDYETFFEKVLQTAAEGDRVGFEVALTNLAEVFRFKGTGILTVTGIPGHGKTEMVDALTLDLARLYGHETIICGFEQAPSEHVIKLIRKLLGLDITCPSYFNDENKPKIKEAYDFIVSKFQHIDTNKVGGNINTILELAAKKVHSSRAEGGNPRYMVLDPFNMLSIKGKFSGHEKIEEILRRLTHFSHQMEILVILVAHPFKMKKDDKTGEYEIPDFYSVKGSSAFFEMSYHGLTVYRRADGMVLIKVLKVKQNNLGTTGAEVLFLYEKAPGRYVPVDEDGNELTGDHREQNWLDKALEQQQLLLNESNETPTN